MNPVTLRKIVENHIVTLEGSAFQDLCDRFCMKLLPDDYTPVRAAGPKGDRKNDGYCPRARVFFAAHATRGETQSAMKKKITSDLEGCLANHPDVAKWVFLTNDTLAGDVEAHVDKLRTIHLNVVIETWGHKRITETICSMFEQPIIEEIIDTAMGPTVEINAEIDHAKELLEKSRPSDARAVLERLWSQHSDGMTSRQKYRVRGNLGHAYYALGEPAKAVDCFLEATAYGPKYEQARTRKALAHLIRGDTAMAHALSSDLLQEFPEERLARAIWVRSVPDGMPFDQIEHGVPEHQQTDAEIQMALAEVAASRGLHDVAEAYASKALTQESSSATIKEAVAELLVRRVPVWEIVQQERTLTRQEKNCLEEACRLYSDAISIFQEKMLIHNVVRVRLRRSLAYLVLGDEERAEHDSLVAYEMDKFDIEAIFSYSGTRQKHGDTDGAIRLLETLIGKAVRPSFEFSFARLLCLRGREGDKERALEMLKNRLIDLENEPEDLRINYLMLLLQIETELNGEDAALQLLMNVKPECVSAAARACLSAEVLRIAGRDQEASSVARTVVDKLSTDSPREDIRRGAIILQNLGLIGEALSLWKRLVQTESVGADTLQAVECAHRCGDIQYILALSSGLRANGIWERRIFELELTYRAEYNDSATEVAILQEFIDHPLDVSYLPQARLRLSVAGIRTGREELIENDPLKLPRVTDVSASLGMHVVEVLRRGQNPSLAAEYAYEMVRLNWDDSCAHSAMVRVFLPDGPVPSIEEPDEVIPGAAVFYREDDTGRECWHIIEDSSLGRPNAMLHEHPPDSALSQAMLHKRAGEQFFLVKDDIQERTATIKEVMSKYKYRFKVCFKELATRFSNTGVVREIVITKNEDQFDFSVLNRMAQRRAQSVNKMMDVYKGELCPIY